MINTYINRAEKTATSQEKWTCISNKIIDNTNLKLNDKSVMAICLMNKPDFNINIKSLQNRTGLKKDKLQSSKDRLIKNGYMKHVHSLLKVWELYIDETGTHTFTKYINKDTYENSGYTQVSNQLLRQVEEGRISVEELGMLLHLLRNKDNYEETEKTLKKKLKLHPTTFEKYFRKLREKGYVDVYRGVIFTDETGTGTFQPMTKLQKRKVLERAISEPIIYKSVAEKELVEELSQLEREAWTELSPELLFKVQVKYLKRMCPMLASAA